LPCDADKVFSLSNDRSRSICLRRYSSGIHTSLDTLDLEVCDPARLDLDFPIVPGAAWSGEGGECRGLVGLGLAFGLEAVDVSAFITLELYYRTTFGRVPSPNRILIAYL